MASHCLRRDSRGCAESGMVLEVLFVVTEGPTPARRVSWRPGADGAPMETAWRWE